MSLHYNGLAISCPHTRRSEPSSRLLTLGVLEPGEWTLVMQDTPVLSRADRPTLVGLDQSVAFDFRGHGHGSLVAVHILHARLTLSIETVHRGLANLRPDLPLYSLALQHLREISALAASTPDVLLTLSAATVTLLRSLLISAAATSEPRCGIDELVIAIERYIDSRIDHPDLGADTIAAAHNVSVRQLYKIWPNTNGTLAGYITSRRLDVAGTYLLTHPHLSIAAIARKHGFTHPTHFTQKFRLRHGVTPSEWRRGNRIDG